MSAVPSEEPKLSAAEQKKKAKAEKQARRAAQKDQVPQEGGANIRVQNGMNGDAKSPKLESGSMGPKSKGEKTVKGQQQHAQPGSSAQASSSQHRHTGSQQQPQPQSQPSTLRRRPSQAAAERPAPKKENKQVELFSHLYVDSHRSTMDGIRDAKDIHPAVLALGFQMSSYEICGSSARCVAMMLAFKEAIQTYTTPGGTSLSRHMIRSRLDPQIRFLISCRPIAESMGNAIRWLKGVIGHVDPDVPEQEAKDYICDRIDSFIRERIILSDEVIAASASLQIKNGSVVLTYAKSAIVEKTILEAHANGTNFRVIVVDSRPLFEGRNLATSLMNAGLEVEYLPFSAIAHAVKQANLVLLGAHSLLSNGRLQSRIGTASIAMQASQADIPVIVCCESVKFSGKVALDSTVLNEIAPPEELLVPAETVSTKAKEGEDDEPAKLKSVSLSDWKDIGKLQILNLMYDVTPAEYIRMIICEYGSLPPSSVPIVHRLANEAGVGS